MPGKSMNTMQQRPVRRLLGYGASYLALVFLCAAPEPVVSGNASLTQTDWSSLVAQAPDPKSSAGARLRVSSNKRIGVLRSDAEIADMTFVKLDYDRFPELPAWKVPTTRVIYVATNGNDAATGTKQAPLRSIVRAVGKAVAGDTIVVRAGTYAEAWERDDYRALVVTTSNLTLMAYPGEKVVMRPATGIKYGIVVNAQNLVIRGIDISGFPSVGILFDVGRNRNRDIVIADLAITGSEEAIAMWEASASVDGLLLANVQAEAIIHCGTGPCTGWRLENVTIEARGEGWGADAFAIESGDNILLVNVTVLGSGSDGIDTKATRVAVLDSRVQGIENNALKLWYGGDVVNTLILRGGQNPVVVEEGRFRLLNSTIGFEPKFKGHRDYSMICGYDERKPMHIEIINSIIANPSGAAWINPESTAVSIRHTLFYTADGSEILIHGDFDNRLSKRADRAQPALRRRQSHG